jgi:large conductance mechanosensitive channel
MKKLFKEFRDFINRGNVTDLAVGVMIGAAFKAIVDSFVGDVVSPILGLFGNVDLSGFSLPLKEGVTLNYGAFLTAIINFLIIAFVLLLFVKAVNKATSIAHKKKEEVPAAPTTKVCPFCKSEIAVGATRCPHCTSQLA